MELCIGWGLEWLIVFDEDQSSKTASAKITKAFFNNNEDEAKKYIYRIEGVEGIEDIFSLGDLKLVVPDLTKGNKEKNSQFVNKYGGKELFARIFNEKVNKGEISLDKLSKTAKCKFENIFNFIKDGFSN